MRIYNFMAFASITVTLKQGQAAKMSVSYRRSMSLNPFSVRYLRPEVELMHLLRMRRHWRRQGALNSTMT